MRVRLIQSAAIFKLGRGGWLCLAVVLLLGSGCSALQVHQGQVDYARGDFKGAVASWQRLAEQGDWNAQFHMGLMHERGHGVAQDYAKAAQWYALAGEQSHPAALSKLGTLYRTGRGVEQDLYKALQYYQRAAREQSPDAHANLGLMYYHGVGVKPDRPRAADYFHRAAVNGNAIAQHRLGLMVLHGDTLGVNADEGAKWISASAKQGYAPAQFELGVLYEEGRSVRRSTSLARRSYEDAALQGHTDAQVNLAMLLIEHHGDRAQALRWLGLAAGKGNAIAQYTLGRLYAEPGRDNNDVEAVIWLLKAAAQDLPAAQALLAHMYDHGRAVPQNPHEAARLYRLAANQGWSPAQQMLGVMHELGRGVAKDSIAAYQWYALAADGGDIASAEHRDRLHFAFSPAQRNQADRSVDRWYVDRNSPDAAAASVFAEVETFRK